MNKNSIKKIKNLPAIHDFSAYRQRREHVLNQIGEQGIAVIFSAPERIRSNDTEHPYRQDSYFYYLTGFNEPESILLLVGKSKQAILFCRDKNPERETWDGFRYGAEQAKQQFGMDEAYSVSTWTDTIVDFLKGHTHLFALWDLYHKRESLLLRAWHALKSQAWTGGVVPECSVDLRLILDSMRLIKDQHELNLLRYAAGVSADGHIRAMQTAIADIYEYQLEAEIVHEFCQKGARAVAYGSIVASGKNACTLHYVNNDALIKVGDLLLIDAGAEYGNYAGDITRTFPVDGTFTLAQKQVYAIVLAANKAVIAAIKEGCSYQSISDLAINILTAGLLDLGLLSGNIEELIATKAYQRFYMHGIGHWLGLDVHDVGGRFANAQSILLKAGMCLTVEPGLYIPDDEDIPPHYRGIGIRIEDNIIVTKNGAEVTTSKVPKEIDEIERLIQITH